LNHFTVPIATSALPFFNTVTTEVGHPGNRKKNPPA